MPVVALGTSEALYAMQADPQIASRFEPFALPRWHESAAVLDFTQTVHQSTIRKWAVTSERCHSWLQKYTISIQRAPTGTTIGGASANLPKVGGAKSRA